MHDNGHLLTYTWDTMLTHAREGLQLCGSFALLLAAERVCEPGMAAQLAIGTRHSRPPTAPECKRPAETSCIHAGASQDSQRAGSSSAAEARHLVDDHGSPRQKSADESIDGLGERDTAGEG